MRVRVDGVVTCYADLKKNLSCTIFLQFNLAIPTLSCHVFMRNLEIDVRYFFNILDGTPHRVDYGGTSNSSRHIDDFCEAGRM